MRAKINKELKELAAAAQMQPGKLGDAIVAELLANNIIEDCSDLWGEKLNDAIPGETPVFTVVTALKNATGLQVCKSNHFDNFCALVLMGDDDCPECGGEMETTDGEQRCVGGDGYETPYEYEYIWEERTCSHCGNVTSNEPDFETEREY